MNKAKMLHLAEVSGRKAGFDPLERLTKGRPQDDSEAERWFHSDRLVALKSIEEKLAKASSDLGKIPGILSDVDAARQAVESAKELLKKYPSHMPKGMFDKKLQKLQAIDLDTKALMAEYRSLIDKIDKAMKTASEALDPYKGDR